MFIVGEPLFQMNTILITGASGRIARRTAELASAEQDTLRLMTRTPQRAPRLRGASVVHGDFAEPATLDAAFAGVDIALVVSASGKPTERAQLHRNAFEAAVRAHVRHVIYLSLQGAAPSSRYPFSRDHYLSEQYLAATGLPHTILRNSFYIDMFLEKVDPDGAIRGPARQTPGAFVPREDAARTAAAVLVDPPGGIHDVTGTRGPPCCRRRHAIVGPNRQADAISARACRERAQAVEPSRTRILEGRSSYWMI